MPDTTSCGVDRRVNNEHVIMYDQVKAWSPGVNKEIT